MKKENPDSSVDEFGVCDLERSRTFNLLIRSQMLPACRQAGIHPDYTRENYDWQMKKKKNPELFSLQGYVSDLERSRTFNLLIRSQMLPACRQAGIQLSYDWQMKKKKNPELFSLQGYVCDLERSRTFNLLIRSQMLYPIELRDPFFL